MRTEVFYLLYGFCLGCILGSVASYVFSPHVPSPMAWVAKRMWSLSTWKRRRPTVIRDARKFAKLADGDEFKAILLVHDCVSDGRQWVLAALPIALAEHRNKAINAELDLPEEFGL
jgi:hypothetical protein